jgi:RimJ/RimL family protein N-acetyltransferase
MDPLYDKMDEGGMEISSRRLGPADRVSLRAPGPAHFPVILSLWTDPRATQFIGGPRDPGLILEHFSEYAEDPEGYSDREDEWWWSIVGAADGEFFGLSSLITKQVEGATAVEIGYFLLPKYWGRGYATEASRLVIGYAFEVLELDSLIALIDPANGASRGVALKLGMAHEATISRSDGSRRDIFRLRRDAWREVRAGTGVER